MAKRVRYEMGSPNSTVLRLPTKHEMETYLFQHALREISTTYGFVARKMTNDVVTDRYEVKVSITLKRQRSVN